MFEIGEFIVYKSNGVCKVNDITYMGTGKDAKKYYVLVPIKDENDKIFTPIDNNSSAMRRVLTKEEVNILIKDIPEIEQYHIDDEKTRESVYKEAIRSCDGSKLIKLIKTICSRNKERLDKGLKYTVLDERYLKLAREGLYSELAFVLGKSRSEMISVVEGDMLGERYAGNNEGF